jgi:hypothetical protein
LTDFERLLQALASAGVEFIVVRMEPWALAATPPTTWISPS